MLESKNYKQGIQISFTDKDFHEGIMAAVDYRGDVTLELKDGQRLEGFLFNCFRGQLEIFPKNSPQKQSVSVDELKSVIFSGKDEAAGKSWEDWVKKRAQMKNIEN